jgi:hypothetical protein
VAEDQSPDVCPGLVLNHKGMSHRKEVTQMAENHIHHVFSSDSSEPIGSVSDSDPHFERKIFEMICDHSMDLDGLSRGDDSDRIAHYRFTNYLGRAIQVDVKAALPLEGKGGENLLETLEPSE